MIPNKHYLKRCVWYLTVGQSHDFLKIPQLASVKMNKKRNKYIKQERIVI
jgi:hypothetical protein